MKKNLFALLAIAAAFASCSSDDVLVEEVQESNGPAIGFHVYTDKMTRATGTNSAELQDFYTTFNVYGWKQVSGSWSSVFDNVTNEYFASDAAGDPVYKSGKPSDEWTFAAGWYYENIRYWDKMATTYQFDAYTPISESGDVTCSSDGKILYGISSKKVDVDDTNLMSTPATSLKFTGFAKDFMTATSTATESPVSLTFSHELAKLNIKLALSTTTKTKQAVTVTDVQVLNLGKSSYFDNTATGTGYVSNWASPSNEATYRVNPDGGYSLNDATKNYNGYYVMEQLLIPQTAAKNTTASSQITEFTEPCVYVEYKIGDEVFKGYYALANIFIGTGTDTSYTFLGGNQYTLTITVGPDPIYFTASVTTWADEVTGNLSAN